MAKLYNVARMTTATAGTGTVTLGSAVSGYLSFANAGVSNGDVVSYTIFEGGNRETGRGTYTSAGTTLSRDTVLNSTAGGTTKITLAGAAEVMITALKEDIANLNEFNSFTANQEIIASDDGASADPKMRLRRISASPAASDLLGQFVTDGKDSGGNDTEYATIGGIILDPADGSEDGGLVVRTMVAGTLANRFIIAQGLYAASLNDQGAGTVNATGHYLNNNRMSDWTMVMKTSDTSRSTTTTSADPALQFSLAASTNYVIRGVIKVSTPAAADFKWGLAGPASPTEVFGGALNSGQTVLDAFAAYPTNLAVTHNQTNGVLLTFEVTVENGVNSGTFSFDWAQNTASGSTLVKHGSYLEYRVI
jgi:hypothetical protein